MRFLAIGECMAELAPADTEGEYRLGFAGDTFNTAWYLARIRPASSVSFLSAVGDDAISGQLRSAIVAGGIDDGQIRTLSGLTVGLYLISLKDGERSFSYWRGQSAARRLADDPSFLEQALKDADLIYFSGITLAILAPDARMRLMDAVRTARTAGKTIAFDPNLRPRLWSDTTEMTQTIMQAAAVSDIALPSFEDEAHWFGDTDPKATADRYAAQGVCTIIVKNGAEAVYYSHGTESGLVPVPPLTAIVDTTAAGDSFNAAALAGLHEGKHITDCIAAACRLAGLVVQGRGALVPVDPIPFGP
ncbi:sugar kinase [Pseudotabrizicola sp. L79]|uniref:sugar kinase n=1 Tax=Pseudotabrizicola sp. L79 TaxID=3118402 RepID=UPI002F954B2D